LLGSDGADCAACLVDQSRVEYVMGRFGRAGDPATVDALCFGRPVRMASKSKLFRRHFTPAAIIPDHRPEEVHVVLN